MLWSEYGVALEKNKPIRINPIHINSFFNMYMTPFLSTTSFIIRRPIRLQVTTTSSFRDNLIAGNRFKVVS